jgi:hypothetical protein
VEIAELLINAKLQREAALVRVGEAMKSGESVRWKRAQEKVDDCNAVINDLENALRDESK